VLTSCRFIVAALFMLVSRKAVPGSPSLHELSFFGHELWGNFVDYMQQARQTADFFGGTAEWATRIHWNVLASEHRVPFVLSGPSLQVVARPKLIAQPKP